MLLPSDLVPDIVAIAGYGDDVLAAPLGLEVAVRANGPDARQSYGAMSHYDEWLQHTVDWLSDHL